MDLVLFIIANGCDQGGRCDDRWGGTWTQSKITRGGGENALLEREYVEAGPRKLAMEKISAMDDEGRPTFSVAPSFPSNRDRLKAAGAGLSSLMSNAQFDVREPLELNFEAATNAQLSKTKRASVLRARKFTFDRPCKGA